ncbi:MAG: dephospho-CoA kinase [Sakamotonia sp.]|jgi:dephospho-CoA kinase
MEIQKKRIIGVTGGVGAGKSTVLALLRDKFGADVFLADTCAHALMEPGTEGLERVVRALGTGILAPDGSVDKNALAQRIFHDGEALKAMNAIIHPMVWETLKKQAEASGQPLAVIEAAVFDTAPAGLFDEIWYVYASRESRILRLMESRGYTREKCERIMENQASEDDYRARCSRVIDNSGSALETEKQLKEILCHEIC